MRISDWSSDVCSSDLFPDKPGSDDRSLIVTKHDYNRYDRRGGASCRGGGWRIPFPGGSLRKPLPLFIQDQEQPHIRRLRIFRYLRCSPLLRWRLNILSTQLRSEEHTSELQSLLLNTYSV